MPYQITRLKNLTAAQIVDSDLLLVTQLSGSGNLPETKTITVGEYKKYFLSASNITSSFYTGSFLGSFYGIFSGSVDSASVSITSSMASTTNQLIYSINNGTSSFADSSSFSFNSSLSTYAVTSSFANSSLYAITASSTVVNSPASNAASSIISTGSVTASVSEKSNYINYSMNNGTIYHSLYSDKSAFADFSSQLLYPNTTTMTKAISSSYAASSVSASFATSSQYSFISTYSQNLSSGEAFAYATFVVKGTSMSNLTIVPLNWHNINSINLTQNNSPQSLVFSINYTDPVLPDNYVYTKCDSSPLTNLTNPDLTDDISTIPTDLTTMVNNYITDNNVMISCWANGCSSTVAEVIVFGIKSQGDGDYGSWATVDPTTYINNTVFSFVAITGVASGSLDVIPPTTLPLKC